MIDSLAAILSKHLNEAPQALVGLISRSQDITRGDYTLPCFELAKQRKQNPVELSKELAQLIWPEFIDRAAAVGPYLNFFLKRDRFAKQILTRSLSDQSQIGHAKRSEKVVLEYSSPNIAKPFHVGHLRNICIGHCLDLVFRHLGYQVVTVDHIGDWGTQFGFVWAGAELWGKPKDATIEDLVQLYIKASGLRKDQEEGKVANVDKAKPLVNELARAYFKRLEAGEPEAEKFWKWCVDISLDYFKGIYQRLGVNFDFQTGEAFYRDKIQSVEDLLKKSGILEDSKGALGINLGKELGFVRVFAEDGRSLYITRDIAAAKYRFDTYSPDKILYVVASQQILHFRQLSKIFERLAHPVSDRIVHVAYGMVPGMSTRAGTIIGLKEFLDEAKDRALQAYHEEVEKRPTDVNEQDVAEKVGIGATSFYFLCHSNVKEFNFSWREALSFQGDSGPYVQYALARLNSIMQKSKEAGIEPTTSFKAELLQEDDAHLLVSLISRFDETLEKVTREYEPQHLAQYVLSLAKAFSASYKKLRVLGEESELAKARLSLFAAVRVVLQVGLRLLGVPPVDKM